MGKLILLVLLLAGCQATGIPGLSAYKIDIQQGNYVTQDMVAKLKPGMTRNQVKFALGTPLIADPFHPERWDYVYVLQKKGKLIAQRRIVAVFDGDKLLRIEGDVVPAHEGETRPLDPAAGTKDRATTAKDTAANSQESAATTKDATATGK